MQGTCAYTNGKVITLPRIDLQDPLKSRLAYGYLAHEAAHIRYTNFKIVRNISDDFLMSSLFNILEDSRIEKLIGAEFIGVWENLELLREYLGESFGAYVEKVCTKSSLQLFFSCLLYYLSVHVQHFDCERSRAAVLFHLCRQRMPHRLLNQASRLALKCADAKNSSQVLTITRKIVKLLKDHGTPRRRQSADLFDSLPEKPEPPQLPDFEKLRQDFLEKTTGDADRVTPCCSPASLMENMGAGGQSARDDMGLMEPGNSEKGRANFLQTIRSTASLRRILTRTVMSWQERACRHTERGTRLNVRRLDKIPLGEMRIYYDRVYEEAYSTSVHILTDVSGSMLACDGGKISRCEEACRCALAVCIALEGIDGIIPMCTFFPGVVRECDVALRAGEWASRKAPYFDQQARGSTPLAQALWYALGRVGVLGCRRNLVLVITDGIPDSVPQVAMALKAAADAGVEVYGLGIRLPFIRELIPQSQVIGEASGLNPAIFELLGKIFGKIRPRD